MRIAALLLLPVLASVLPGEAATGKRSSRRVVTMVRSATDAKAIAEQETGGTATSARRIPLNGASGGWEVEVHMPKEERGWRCVIDNDTRMVYTKTRIPNPPAAKRKR